MSRFETTVDGPEDEEIPVSVEYDAIWQPAKLSGPPDQCWPDESSMELTRIVDSDGWEVRLTDNQYDRLVDEAWDDFHTKRLEWKHG